VTDGDEETGGRAGGAAMKIRVDGRVAFVEGLVCWSWEAVAAAAAAAAATVGGRGQGAPLPRDQREDARERPPLQGRRLNHPPPPPLLTNSVPQQPPTMSAALVSAVSVRAAVAPAQASFMGIQLP